MTFSSSSVNGRDLITASCARRTLAAATSFIADVIFFVFLIEPMRVRSSRMLSPMATAGRGAAQRAATGTRAGAEKAAAPATRSERASKRSITDLSALASLMRLF